MTQQTQQAGEPIRLRDLVGFRVEITAHELDEYWSAGEQRMIQRVRATVRVLGMDRSNLNYGRVLTGLPFLLPHTLPDMWIAARDVVLNTGIRRPGRAVRGVLRRYPSHRGGRPYTALDVEGVGQ